VVVWSNYRIHVHKVICTLSDLRDPQRATEDAAADAGTRQAPGDATDLRLEVADVKFFSRCFIASPRPIVETSPRGGASLPP
jgi:hypothetical protein